jgi:hypothetical protein
MRTAISRGAHRRTLSRRARPGGRARLPRHGGARAGGRSGCIPPRGGARFFLTASTQQVRTPSATSDWLAGMATLVAIGSWTLALVLLGG